MCNIFEIVEDDEVRITDLDTGEVTRHGGRPSFFIHQVNMLTNVLLADHRVPGTMILDTACLRLNCGPEWAVAHNDLIAQQQGLKIIDAPESESYQYGAGPVITSSVKKLIPAAIVKFP